MAKCNAYHPFIEKRQIIAIGRNYAEHAKELNNAIPKEPFFFLKPTSSYVANGGKIEIPQGVVAHHESSFTKSLALGPRLISIDLVELGVVIGKGGRDIPESEADSHVSGYSKSFLKP